MEERVVRNDEVRGSIPLGSTRMTKAGCHAGLRRWRSPCRRVVLTPAIRYRTGRAKKRAPPGEGRRPLETVSVADAQAPSWKRTKRRMTMFSPSLAIRSVRSSFTVTSGFFTNG